MSRATGLWVGDEDRRRRRRRHRDRRSRTPSAFGPILPLIDGQPYRHPPDGRLLTPHTLELEREIVEVRYELARRYATDNRLNHLTADPADAWIGIVASGITYREVMEAFGRLGLRSEREIEACGIRLLKMGMPLPFDAAAMRDFARGLREILVIEEKAPNARIAAQGRPVRPAATAVGGRQVRRDGRRAVRRATARSTPTRILPLLRRRLAATLGDRLVPEPDPAPNGSG